jgi:hypothetical protein
MKISYLGVSSERFIIYLSPLEMNLIELISFFKEVKCNELYLDGKEGISIKNKTMMVDNLISLLINKNQVVEFNLILDETFSIKNIWWNDLFIEGPILKLQDFTNYIQKSNLLNKKQISRLLNKPNVFESKNLSPQNFSSYIQDSDRYEYMLNLNYL